MRSTGKFTDKAIINLKPQDKQYYLWEGDGFAIRVTPAGVKTPNGAKTWLFIYTFQGKRREMNLGRYPAVTLATARDRLTDVRKSLSDGIDPQEAGFTWHKNPERVKREAARQAEEDRRNPDVKQLAKDYLAKHAKVKKRESSAKEDERLLDKNVLPEWGDRKVKDIRRRDIKLLLESVQDRPALCNNILKLTRKMFNFAVDEEIIDMTPFVNIKAPVNIVRRDRALSQDEIKALWTTELPKASMSDEVKRILKLILLTGQRSGEVAGIHAREIDGNWWTIPAERSKNKRPTRVYLTKTAKEVLGESKGYFFPSPKNGQVGKDKVIINTHIDDNAVAYAIRRNLKDYQPRRPIKGETVSMVKVAEDKKMAMAHFTPHDLRRTFSSLLPSLGVSKEIIHAILNHSDDPLDQIYILYKYDKEKQLAMEAWERKIKSIITGKKSNVIQIGKKRA